MDFKAKPAGQMRRRSNQLIRVASSGLLMVGGKPAYALAGTTRPPKVTAFQGHYSVRQMFTGAIEPVTKRPEQSEPVSNSFAAFLQNLASGQDAMEVIREGLHASILKDTAVWFGIPLQRVRSIARLPETTAHTLAKRGSRLDPAVSERIWRLADVALMATDVFEDEEAARTWLRSPNRTFQGGAPMDYLDTEPGAAMVRQVLNAIATGGAA